MTGEKRSQFSWCNDFFGVQNSFGINFCFQLGRSGSSWHGKSSTVLWAPPQCVFYSAEIYQRASTFQPQASEKGAQQISMIHWHNVNVDKMWMTYPLRMDDIWTTNYVLKDNLQVLLKTLVLMSPAASHATDWWLQSGTRWMWFGISPLSWSPRWHSFNAIPCCGCDMQTMWIQVMGRPRWNNEKRPQNASSRIWLTSKLVNWSLRQPKELKMQFHASKGRLVYFPVGISSSLPTQQATNWNMWAYNELLWMETAGLFQIVSNQKRTWKKLMLAMAVHANHGTQTLAGIVNLSYLSADIIVLIHKDLRLLEADRAIALHHGGSKPQRCHWFGAKRFATTMILTSNRQENNIRFLEQLGKQWQQCSSDMFVYFC